MICGDLQSLKPMVTLCTSASSSFIQPVRFIVKSNDDRGQSKMPLVVDLVQRQKKNAHHLYCCMVYGVCGMQCNTKWMPLTKGSMKKCDETSFGNSICARPELLQLKLCSGSISFPFVQRQTRYIFVRTGLKRFRAASSFFSPRVRRIRNYLLLHAGAGTARI